MTDNINISATHASRSPSMLFGPPSAAPPDMICPIILCMFGSDNIEVAMFINIGLPNRLLKSKPPAGRPAATDTE